MGPFQMRQRVDVGRVWVRCLDQDECTRREKIPPRFAIKVTARGVATLALLDQARRQKKCTARTSPPLFAYTVLVYAQSAGGIRPLCMTPLGSCGVVEWCDTEGAAKKAEKLCNERNCVVAGLLS